MSAQRRALGEQGSVPLALLVAIIVAGLVVTLVARSITGQQATRFDRDFTEVVHVADAGVQEALVRLNDGALTHNTPFAGQVDGPDNSYTVTPEQVGPIEWKLTSTATLDGVQRTVVATTKEVPLFAYALFARNGIGFNGANATDSYSLATGTWCTGNGIVGTDGVLEFSGLAPSGGCHDAYKKVTVDAAHLYDCGDDDAATCRDVVLDGQIRCTHTGGENCDFLPGNPQGPLQAFPDPWKLTPEDELEKVVTETAACESAGWLDTFVGVSSAPGAWETDGDTLTPRPATSGRDFYCVTSLTLKDTAISRGPGGEPVRIYVRDSIEVKGSSTTVNCPGCTHTNYMATLPDASALQVIGTGVANFKLADPQISFAGTVYVPNAVCDGPAGADIFGALVCGKADNVGNWNFHYDDALREQGGSGVYAIDQYREERP